MCNIFTLQLATHPVSIAATLQIINANTATIASTCSLALRPVSVIVLLTNIPTILQDHAYPAIHNASSARVQVQHSVVHATLDISCNPTNQLVQLDAHKINLQTKQLTSACHVTSLAQAAKVLHL